MLDNIINRFEQEISPTRPRKLQLLKILEPIFRNLSAVKIAIINVNRITATKFSKLKQRLIINFLLLRKK